MGFGLLRCPGEHLVLLPPAACRGHPRHQLRQHRLRQALPQALPCGVAQLGWASCVGERGGGAGSVRGRCMSANCVCTVPALTKQYVPCCTCLSAQVPVSRPPCHAPQSDTRCQMQRSARRARPSCRRQHAAVVQHAVWRLPLLLRTHHCKDRLTTGRGAAQGCNHSGQNACKETHSDTNRAGLQGKGCWFKKQCATEQQKAGSAAAVKGVSLWCPVGALCKPSQKAN